MAKTTPRTEPARPKKTGKRSSEASERAVPKTRRERAAAFERAAGAAKGPAALDGRTGTIDRADRIAAGRALRKVVPRSSHGDWEPAADRPDPVAVLEAQGESRVTDLLPIRHGRMAESQFGFYRGAAAGMAADLASTPNTGITVQLCGDGHLVNFGGFATPERRLIFDVASFAVAARAKGLSDELGEAAVLRMTLAYAGLVSAFATSPTLDAWHWTIDTDLLVAMAATVGDVDTQRIFDEAIARAHAHNNLQAVHKLTAVVDGRRQIVDQLPLVGHVGGDDDIDRMQSLLDGYQASPPDDVCHLLDRFTLTDAARKVVGVGSVGSRCWIALLEGGGADDPLILQIKEAEASVLEPHLGRSICDNHARRVVEGQRLMQAASDMFLGWTHDQISGCDYYWRNLRDMKVSADVNNLPTSTFMNYAELCGGTLARAHARSGDAPAISGYLGKGDVFGKALGRFATSYADQTALDHAALVQAITDGRVAAESDV